MVLGTTRPTTWVLPIGVYLYNLPGECVMELHILGLITLSKNLGHPVGKRIKEKNKNKVFAFLADFDWHIVLEGFVRVVWILLGNYVFPM